VKLLCPQVQTKIRTIYTTQTEYSDLISVADLLSLCKPNKPTDKITQVTACFLACCMLCRVVGVSCARYTCVLKPVQLYQCLEVHRGREEPPVTKIKFRVSGLSHHCSATELNNWTILNMYVYLLHRWYWRPG